MKIRLIKDAVVISPIITALTTEWKYLIPVQTQVDKGSNTNGGKVTLTLLDDHFKSGIL